MLHIPSACFKGYSFGVEYQNNLSNSGIRPGISSGFASGISLGLTSGNPPGLFSGNLQKFFL